MKIDLFSIGKFTIHGYGLMIAIGILCCVAMASYRAKKNGLDPEAIVDIGIYGVIGGFVGAKILYVIVEFKTFIKDPKSVLGSEGFVVYGGIIAGFLTAIVYCRIKKLYFLEYFDLAVASISMAQGFGRIGCFLAGCCYGKETSGPLAVTFTSSDFAPNNIPLIPTQIYSSILDFVHFLLLLYVAKHKKADGQVAACYLIFYSIGRFIIEFFRGDIERGSVGSFSTSQFISIFTAIAGIIVLFVATVNKKDSRNYHKK